MACRDSRTYGTRHNYFCRCSAVHPAGAVILLVLIVLIGVLMASLSYTVGLMTREGGTRAGITNTSSCRC
jgi:hypothetical protein